LRLPRPAAGGFPVWSELHLIPTEDAVQAQADLTGRAPPVELLAEHRQQPRKPRLVAGAIGADGIEPGRHEIPHALFDSSRTIRTSSSDAPATSGASQSSTVAGANGHASPQPIVTAQSACSCSSADQLLRAPVSEVNTDLAHRLDDVRPDGSGGLEPDRLGTDVVSGRAVQRMPAPSASAPRCGCRRTARISWSGLGSWVPAPAENAYSIDKRK
jgi:hypothetical protein